MNTDVRSTVVSSQTLFIGAVYSGLLRTSISSCRWIPSNDGLPATWVTDVAVTRTGTFLAASLAGLFVSTNEGSTWDMKIPGMPFNSVAIAPDGDIYGGAGNGNGASSGGVYRSTNDGATWFQSGLVGVAVVDIKADALGTVYVADYGCGHLSRDKGSTWTTLFSQSMEVVSVEVDPGGCVFALASVAGIEKSTDRGVTWNLIKVDSSARGYTNLATLPTGTLLCSTDAGIFRSTDDGRSWRSANGGIPSSVRWVNDLTVDNCGNVLASTPVGTFLSTDSGDSWKQVGQLSNVSTSRAVNYRQGRFLLGTQEGVFIGQYY
jgi:photosystem II stability/assembly factor-like uncharacterized protein